MTGPYVSFHKYHDSNVCVQLFYCDVQGNPHPLEIALIQKQLAVIEPLIIYAAVDTEVIPYAAAILLHVRIEIKKMITKALVILRVCFVLRSSAQAIYIY